MLRDAAREEYFEVIKVYFKAGTPKPSVGIYTLPGPTNTGLVPLYQDLMPTYQRKRPSTIWLNERETVNGTEVEVGLVVHSWVSAATEVEAKNLMAPERLVFSVSHPYSCSVQDILPVLTWRQRLQKQLESPDILHWSAMHGDFERMPLDIPARNRNLAAAKQGTNPI